ncbi:MAG: class I SAM-dependent methyltransferase, partial [Phenylobacterium sp.]
MADENYRDPRLAALYDALNPWGRDTDFYLALAGPAPQRILDIGCGTGLLTAAFTGLGHEACGVD